MIAHAGGVAAGHDIKGSAIGPNSQATYVERQYLTQSRAPVEWPILVGEIPVRPSAFQRRAGLREEVDRARAGPRTKVPAGDAAAGPHPPAGSHTWVQVLSGGGGVGKSQLAAEYAREALQNGTDLVLWTSASDVQQVIASYAHAARLVQAPGVTGKDVEADARAVKSWLAATDRRWLVVLDDITDAHAIEPWWPDSPRGSGWVLATTRLKDPRLAGGGRVRIDVDVYSPPEASAYLTERLEHDRKTHLADDQVGTLVQALGHLPLALGHAAAYMLHEDVPCGTYLERFADRSARLHDLLPRWADFERYGRQVTATLLLALDATDQDDLGPLARAAIRVAALLDPSGQPAALWQTPALTGYLTDQRPAAPATRHLFPRRHVAPHRPVTKEVAQEVLRLLDRYALITYDSASDGPRAVRIHSLTARAVREATPQDARPAVTTAAAQALLQAWPDIDAYQPELVGVLRTNTDLLAAQAGDDIWASGNHVVLYRAGVSLLSAGLHNAALAYWERMVATCEQHLGDAPLFRLAARSNLAASYETAGRDNRAMHLAEQVAAEAQQLLGPAHAFTLAALTNLAISYRNAKRADDAILLEERVLVLRTVTLGSDHTHTLAAHANLAASYGRAGRVDEAIAMLEQVTADRERLDPDAPGALTAREHLGACYLQAARLDDAITIQEQVVADGDRLLGPDHPNSIDARAILAAYYSRARRIDEAIALLGRVIVDRERLLGRDHLDTLSARADLCAICWEAGRLDEADVQRDLVIAAKKRLLSEDNPDRLDMRAELARRNLLPGE